MGVLVAAGLIPLATAENNGLMRGTNSYFNNFNSLKICSSPSLSQASFLIFSNNAYSTNFLIFVDFFVSASDLPNLYYKVLYGQGVESEFEIGHKLEDGKHALYVNRSRVSMCIQCLCKTKYVELQYLKEKYPNDCTSGILVE